MLVAPNATGKTMSLDVVAFLRRLASGRLEAPVNESAGDSQDFVVLVPELEVCVWSDSPEAENALGWRGEQTELRTCLLEQGYLDPREAVSE